MAKTKKASAKAVTHDAPPTKSLLDDIKDKRKIEYDARANKRVKRDIEEQLKNTDLSDSGSDYEDENNEEEPKLSDQIYGDVFSKRYDDDSDVEIVDDEEIDSDEASVADEDDEEIESDDEQVDLSDLIATVKKQNKNDAKADISALHQLNATQKYVAPTSVASLERATAYEMLKDDLKKWEPITNYLESSRTIPVAYVEGRGRAKGTVTSKTESKTKFEQEMDKKLETTDSAPTISLFDRDDDVGGDISRLTKDELLKRNREIAQKRLQLSYQQQKQARLKKIKSKTYRKILKKQRLREQEAQEEELAKLDPEEAQAKVVEREKDYIKERVTLRHKNSSQWVRQSMRSGAAHYNRDVNLSVSEQLRIGDDLRRRQKRQADDSEEIADQIMEGENETLEKLREEVMDKQEEGGLAGMKFMKKAREKKLLESLDLIDQIERDVRGEQEEEAPITGRMKFVGKKTHGSQKSKVEGNLAVKEQPAIVSANGPVTVDDVPTVKMTSKAERFNLKNEVNRTSIPKELKEKKVTSLALSNGTNKRKRVPDASDASNPWLNTAPEQKESRLSKKQKKDAGDDETELLVHDIATTTTAPTASAFDEVKRQAFASDDLSLQFETEKRMAMESEVQLPEMESSVLPGWGQWVGKGTNWKQDVEKKKKSIQRIKKKLLEEKVRERVDSDIGHVIIRETAKIPDKYLNKNVAQDKIMATVHDRGMTHPLGPEWNSLTGHKEATQPRIKTRKGTRIAPLDYEEARREVNWKRVNDVKTLHGDVTRKQIESELEKPIEKLEIEEKKKPKPKVDKDSKIKAERNRIITEIDHSVDVIVPM